MIAAADLVSLGDGLWLWQTYDPAIKSDLFSSAAKSRGRLFLIDPIPLAPAPLAELKTHGAVAAVLITNSNHPRAAVAFGRLLDTAILALEPVTDEFRGEKVQACAGGEIMPGLTAIPIEGAVPGEMAFHFADNGGTLIIGDALINFEPYGFTLLPVKYCSNQRRMHASLRQLLDWPFERLLFAHGLPILNCARARLDTLLR